MLYEVITKVVNLCDFPISWKRITQIVITSYSIHYTKLYEKKYRTQMCDEFIELFNSGLIRLPYEYKDEVVTLVEKINEETEKVTKYSLSLEESESLMEIDIMKKEITSIYKFENAEKTSYTYALPKDKESKMNDDRFYTIIMLAHYLYWLRNNFV